MNAIERATVVADHIILTGTRVAKFDLDNLPYVQYAFNNIHDAGRFNKDHLWVGHISIIERSESRFIIKYEDHSIAFESKDHPELFAAVDDLNCIIKSKFLKVMCKTSDVIADLRSHLKWIYCQIDDAYEIVVGKVKKIKEYDQKFDQEFNDLKSKYHKDTAFHASAVWINDVEVEDESDCSKDGVVTFATLDEAVDCMNANRGIEHADADEGWKLTRLYVQRVDYDIMGEIKECCDVASIDVIKGE